MKKFYAYLITLGLTVCLSTTVFAVFSGVTYDGIRYTSDGSSATILGYGGSSRSVLTIPDTLNGVPVTNMDKEAFTGLHHLTGVILPDSMIDIGDEAFENMLADHFTLGNGIVHIGNNSFELCEEIKQITLPDSVESIGAGAFTRCSSLNYIVIPSKVQELQEETFQKCPHLKKVVIMNPDTEISSLAFDSPSDSRVIICGITGSKVEKFASDNGYIFEQYIPVNINGQEITPNNAIPELRNGSVFVPLRFIVETLHHTVEYTDNKSILIDGGAYMYQSGTDYIDGTISAPVTLECKPYVDDGVTMVGLDFIRKILQCNISWNKTDNVIEITAK